MTWPSSPPPKTDCTIIKWSVETGRKLHVIPRAKKGTQGQPSGHSSHILCMAISSDGKYLASGDRSKLILIWEAQSCQHGTPGRCVGTGLPKRYPPALQNFPRPLSEGVERSRELLCGDPVSALGQIACECRFTRTSKFTCDALFFPPALGTRMLWPHWTP